MFRNDGDDDEKKKLYAAVPHESLLCDIAWNARAKEFPTHVVMSGPIGMKISCHSAELRPGAAQQMSMQRSRI